MNWDRKSSDNIFTITSCKPVVNFNSNLGAATNAFILKQLFVTAFSLNLILKKMHWWQSLLISHFIFWAVTAASYCSNSWKRFLWTFLPRGRCKFPKLSFLQSLLFWLWEFGVESNNISQLIMIIPFSSISLKMFWYILLYKEIAFWLLRGWKKSCILHLFH